MESHGKNETFDGELKIYSKGSAFVTNHLTAEKYFIKQNFLKGALDGDRVRISFVNLPYQPFPSARVQNILKRGKECFTAKLYKQNNNNNYVLAFIYPHQSKKILIRKADHEIDDGDIFQVKVIDWRENHKSAYAQIIKLIAKSKNPKSDYRYIASRYGLDSFNKHVYPQKEKIKHQSLLKKGMEGRTDLTHLITFTIDPETAMDFDDAISITKEKDQVELYIHVADVTHFVKEGSEIDSIAFERGNSYYFSEKTIHMLPDFLSTNVCSLVPKEKRLALTIKIILSESDDVINFSIFESIIKSDRKFNYNEVENILSSKKKSGFLGELRSLNLLTDKLKKKRLSKDGFVLHHAEILFELDDSGTPIKSYEPERLRSHSMVEECMLLANQLASKKVYDVQKKYNHFGFFRNHENLSLKNETYLKDLISIQKIDKKNIQSNLRAKDLNNILSNLDSDQRKVLSSLFVRKMQKANYSTKVLGHYGLGLKSYTHFTSPIRRYSDIIVHRMIKESYNNNNYIFNIITGCNESELSAQNAERDYKTIKGLKLLERKKNCSLIGYIVKIKKSRIIVNEKSSGVDGIILRKHIPFAEYEFHEKMFFMRNKVGSETFEIGQKVNIKVDKVDLILEHVFFKFDS